MDNHSVLIRNLSHRYSVQWAVKDFHLEISRTGVSGLLGSNGAGKSTIMNIMCGVLKPTCGEIFINGIDLQKDPVEAKRCIGFLPQQVPLYKDLSVEEYLSHAAKLRMMPLSQVKGAVDEALEKCSITHFRHRLLKNLSGGYQQRAGIAQAIVHNPQFVVLDEPTNGLDPNQVVEIRSLIRSLSTYHTVLLSTHILSEVQALCNDVCMIESGKLVFSGSMENFDNYICPESFLLTLHAAPSVDELVQVTENNGVDPLENGSFRIHFDGNNATTEAYIRAAVERNWGFDSLIVERSSLEETFAALSEKNKKN